MPVRRKQMLAFHRRYHDVYNMKALCKFCQKFGEPGNGDSSEPWDRILFETPNFVVVPTIGSIIPGWLLVVSRHHFLCMGTMGDALMSELRDVRRLATRALVDQFGPVASFEHGPAEPRTSVGCGVDHAHLHLIATDVRLVDGARRITQEPLSWVPVDGLDATTLYHQRRIPYVYVELPDGKAWLGTSSNIESQLFRKVIAAASGRTDVFDWKCHSFEGNAHETVRAVEAWKLKQRS